LLREKLPDDCAGMCVHERRKKRRLPAGKPGKMKTKGNRNSPHLGI